MQPPSVDTRNLAGSCRCLKQDETPCQALASSARPSVQTLLTHTCTQDPSGSSPSWSSLVSGSGGASAAFFLAPFALPFSLRPPTLSSPGCPVPKANMAQTTGQSILVNHTRRRPPGWESPGVRGCGGGLCHSWLGEVGRSSLALCVSL